MEITDGRAVVDRDRCEGNAVCVRSRLGCSNSTMRIRHGHRRPRPGRAGGARRAGHRRVSAHGPVAQRLGGRRSRRGEEDRRRTPCTRVNTRPHTTSGLIGGAGTKHDGRDTRVTSGAKRPRSPTLHLDDAKKAAGHDDRTGGHRHRLTVLVLSNRDKARRHRCPAQASPGKQFPPPWKLKPNGVRGGGLDGLRTPLPRSVLAARARLAAPSPPNGNRSACPCRGSWFLGRRLITEPLAGEHCCRLK